MQRIVEIGFQLLQCRCNRHRTLRVFLRTEQAGTTVMPCAVDQLARCVVLVAAHFAHDMLFQGIERSPAGHAARWAGQLHTDTKQTLLDEVGKYRVWFQLGAVWAWLNIPAIIYPLP